MGCGVLRVWLVTTLPGGSGTWPSATTSGRVSAFTRVFDAHGVADVKPLLHPAPDRSHKSRGGAPEGGHPAST